MKLFFWLLCAVTSLTGCRSGGDPGRAALPRGQDAYDAYVGFNGQDAFGEPISREDFYKNLRQ